MLKIWQKRAERCSLVNDTNIYYPWNKHLYIKQLLQIWSNKCNVKGATEHVGVGVYCCVPVFDWRAMNFWKKVPVYLWTEESIEVGGAQEAAGQY